MINYKTNINKFPSAILEQSKKLLESTPYEIEVETDHSITIRFKGEKTITTTLLFNFDGNLINYTCDCGKLSLCEHIGAVLLILEDRKNIVGSDFSYEDYKIFHNKHFSRNSTNKQLITKLSTLLETYSESSVTKCLIKYFFDSSANNKTSFFLSFFQLFEYSRLSDALTTTLKDFLKQLIVAYNDTDLFRNEMDINIDLEASDKIFLALFKREIYGSLLIDEVYIDSLNKRIFPKNIYLSSFLNHETFNSKNNGGNLDLNGLETLYDNKDFLNVHYPISDLTNHNLLENIIESNNSYHCFNCLYELSDSFLINKYQLIRKYFLSINNNPDKINDSKKIIQFVSKKYDLNDFLNELMDDINFNSQFWMEYASNFASPYSLYRSNSSDSLSSKLENLEQDISLEDIKHLIEEDYPFYNHESFFKNKKIVSHYKDNEISEESKNELLIYIAEYLNELPDQIDSVIAFYDALPVSTIQFIYEKANYLPIKAYIDLNFLDKLGFKKF